MSSCLDCKKKRFITACNIDSKIETLLENAILMFNELIQAMKIKMDAREINSSQLFSNENQAELVQSIIDRQHNL